MMSALIRKAAAKPLMKPAKHAVNALVSFGVTMITIKNGRKITAVQMGWWMKGVG